MELVELVLIFFEELLSGILKIKNKIIKNIILLILMLMVSAFVFLMLYILVNALLSSMYWYIKLFLVCIFVPCMYVIARIIVSGYKEWKQSSGKLS